MKPLTCEMCGSTDLIKQDGVFVCQTCGTKYSVEEAKKMMVEGTVDVTGSTIKIDNVQKLDNLRKLADRAKEEDDTKTAEKYFAQILLEDPNDWEANFYTIYYAAHNITIGQLGAAANRVSNCFEPVLKLIKETIPEDEKRIEAYMEIVRRTLSFETLLLSNAYDHIGSSLEIMYENIDNWVVPAVSMVVILGDKIADLFEDYETANLLYSTAKISSDSQRTATMKKLHSAIVSRENSMTTKIEQIAQERRDRYWEEHADEKAALDSEKKSLHEQIAEYETEIDDLPQNAVIKDIETQVASKTKERDSLGLFKGKEKKALQAEIDILNDRLSDAQKAKDTAASPNNIRIAILQKRIAEIDAELTKDR